MFGRHNALATQTGTDLDSVALVRQVKLHLPWLIDENGHKAGRDFFNILFQGLGDNLLEAERLQQFTSLESDAELLRAEMYLRNLKVKIGKVTHDLDLLYDAVIVTIDRMPMSPELRKRHLHCFRTHVLTLANGVRRVRTSRKK